MPQQFDGQYENEEVQLVFRKHPIVLRKPLLVFLVILLVFMLPLTVYPTEKWALIAFGGGFLLGCLVFAYMWMGWYFSVYIVTDQRIIHIEQKGFFHRQVVELGLDKVQNVNYEVSGFNATVFKFGTIIVQTFVGDLILNTIHNPEKIHRKLSHIVKTHQEEAGSAI